MRHGLILALSAAPIASAPALRSRTPVAEGLSRLDYPPFGRISPRGAVTTVPPCAQHRQRRVRGECPLNSSCMAIRIEEIEQAVVHGLCSGIADPAIDEFAEIRRRVAERSHSISSVTVPQSCPRRGVGVYSP